MASNIPSSNLSPSGKEEAFLRELLAKHDKELSATEETVESKHLELDLCSKGIHRLESALKTARQALDVYQKHRDNLNSTQQALSTHLNDSLPLFDDIPSCEKIKTFLAGSISGRTAACKAEIEVVRTACEKLRHTVHILDEELRCQRTSFTFSELSLQTSLATRDSVRKTVDIIWEKFRAIKRVPVEIWLDILGMVIYAAHAEWKVTMKDYDLLYPTMRLAQVCESWRQIILDTPKLWTTISCGGTAEKNQHTRDNLMSLLVTRAQGLQLNIVDRENPYSRPPRWGGWWKLRSESATTLLSRYNYHLRSADQYPVKRLACHAWPIPLRAIFQAQSFNPQNGLTDEMVKHLNEVPDLTLINIPLREAHCVVSDSLTRLKLEFNSRFTTNLPFGPPDDGSANCWMRSLLNHSLQTLELSQHTSGVITWKGPKFQLPNLQLLSVTPHEHDLLQFLDAPAINTLKISYPPGPLTLSFEKWATSFSTICASICNLQVSWAKRTSPNVVSLFTVLWEHAPKLQAVAFSDANMNGEGLCDAFENRLKGCNRLASLAIHGCIGISRTHCERIAPMVDGMSVFNSEFRMQKEEPPLMIPC